MPITHEAGRPTCVRLNSTEAEMIEFLRREGTVSDAVRRALRAAYEAARALEAQE